MATQCFLFLFMWFLFRIFLFPHFNLRLPSLHRSCCYSSATVLPRGIETYGNSFSYFPLDLSFLALSLFPKLDPQLSPSQFVAVTLLPHGPFRHRPMRPSVSRFLIIFKCFKLSDTSSIPYTLPSTFFTPISPHCFSNAALHLDPDSSLVMARAISHH